MNTSFFGELLASITEQGRALIAAGRGRGSDEPLADLCDALLSGRGEASGVALAGEILSAYEQLPKDGKLAFFEVLLNRFGFDFDRIHDSVEGLKDNPQDPVLLRRLHAASEPRRQELIRRLNLAPGGTKALVAMREDLLNTADRHSGLQDIDRDFEHLFSSWFNRGFLVMKRMDWQTPANILEKIIEYEAVHEIKGWKDLRRRIGLKDRRLYAFFHPALVDDLLIFVEVALTREIPGAIAPILTDERKEISPEEANTAVFYSISNCQRGLRGISFGNFLIKQVVEELQRELPSLKTFVTLSPVPKFANWLHLLMENESILEDPHGLRTLYAQLQEPGWTQSEEAVRRLGEILPQLCSHYIVREKDHKGRPFDPVARFHIGNGARLEQVNWLGDVSANGLSQSHSLMVNYLYDLKYIERNHEAFAAHGTVAASSKVMRMAKSMSEMKQQTIAAS